MVASEEIVATGQVSSQASRGLAILAFVWISGVMVASVVWNPAPPAASGDYFTVCGFKNLTGLPCPGCGLTHSFCSLAKSEIADAFAFNALGPPTFLLLILLWLRAIAVLCNRLSPVAVFDRAIERFRVVKRMALAFGVYGVIRIVYVLAFNAQSFHQSPLARLAARMFG